MQKRGYLRISAVIILLTAISILSLKGQNLRNSAYTANEFAKQLRTSDYYFTSTQVDSCIQILNRLQKHPEAKKDSNKIKIHFRLAQIYNILEFPDLLEKHLTIAEELFSALPESQKNYLDYSEILHTKGSLCSYKGDNTGSINYTLKSVGIKEKLLGVNDTSMLRGISNLSTAYLSLNFFETGFNYLLRARDIIERKKHKSESVVVGVFLKLARAYSQKGEYELGEKYMQLAYKIGKNTYPKGSIQESDFYRNLGMYYLYVSRIDKAIPFYETAEQILLRIDSVPAYKIATLYTVIGNIYNTSGDIHRSLDYYKRSYSILSKVSDQNMDAYCRLLNNMAGILSEVGDDKSAEEYFLECISKASSASLRSKSLWQLAGLYGKMEDDKNAEKYFKIAMNHNIKHFGHNHLEVHYVQRQYAIFQLLRGRSSGVQLMMKAYNGFWKIYGAKNTDGITCLQDIGNYYHLKGNYSEALKYIQLALINCVTDYNDENIYSTPSPDHSIYDYNLLSTLSTKAKVLIDYVNKGGGSTALLKTAINTVDLSLDLIEKIRSDFSESASYFIMSEFYFTFHSGIKAAMSLYSQTGDIGYLNKAFSYSGRGRASIFQSSIRAEKALQIASIPSLLSKAEKELREIIPFYERLIYDEKQFDDADTVKIKEWEDALYKYKVNYANLIHFLEANYKDYYQLKHQHKVASVKDVQKRLKNHETYIEYSLSEENLVIFLITKNSFKAKNIALNNSFHASLDTLTNTIRQFDMNQSPQASFNVFCRNSYKIFQYLIEPILNDIEGKTLIIVPDDKLGFIPFDVLIDKMPDSNSIDFRKLKYLLKNYAIHYTYSATIFIQQEVQETRKNPRIYAFAPTYQKGNSPQRSDSTLLSLSELKGANNEIKKILKIFKGKGFSGEKATETQFRNSVGDADILHLAMHTLISDEKPMFSRLVFSEDISDSLNDRLLNTHEIYNLKIKASLAVLSACNTGYGKLMKGEGILSLTRAFMFAGCPSIVMTLWPLSDFSGEKLFPEFYSNLALGMTKSESLQKAKIEYLKSCDQLHSHPYFWANAVCIGNDYPIVPENVNKYSFFPFYTLGLLTIIIALIIIRKKKKAKFKAG